MWLRFVRALVLVFVITTSAALIAPIQTSPSGQVTLGIETVSAESIPCDGSGKDRTSETPDWFNWQTGVNRHCTIPKSWAWNQCAIIDAAWLKFDGGPMDVGPIFTIVPGPMDGSRIEVGEGQVTIPSPGQFAKRVLQRLQVAHANAMKVMVDDGHGGVRHRELPTQLELLNLDCPDDP